MLNGTIETSAGIFTTEPEARAALSAIGLSEAVIDAIINDDADGFLDADGNKVKGL